MYTSKEIIDKTNHYGAHNYAPKPVVIVKAEGAVVTDPEDEHLYQSVQDEVFDPNLKIYRDEIINNQNLSK